MLKDRIVIRHIVFDQKPTILHDRSVWRCIDSCGEYDEGMCHITGEYMLQGDIEVVYLRGKYTRLQRFFFWLLKLSM